MTPEPGKFYLATGADGVQPTPFIVVASPGSTLTVWGFSIYRGRGDYRTLGMSYNLWSARNPTMVVTADRDRRLSARPRKPKAAPTSLANRGRSLESALATQHEAYALTGRAFVLRTSAPMRILRRLPKGGQFVAVFEAVGLPDYFAVSGGRLFVFDAKEHAGRSFPFSALPEHQSAAFDAVTKQGAAAGLVVHLPEINAAWWVGWDVLGPRWWLWKLNTGRARPGTASADVEWLDAYGVRLRGVSWLEAVTR